MVPVWGERHIGVFLRATLPALRYALEALSVDYRLLLYADKDQRLIDATNGMPVLFRKVPGPDRSFMSLSNAHRDALDQAPTGSRMVLLTADLVLSVNSLVSCSRIFQSGKRLVCCMGMRVNDVEPPPIPALGRTLLAWGWDHRHRMTRESTWPNGISYDIWRMYFERGDEAICRLCLPHPIALLKDGRQIRFSPTIDVNVVSNYKVHEMHMVTDPDEVAMIELSPPEKEFLETEPMHKRLERNLPSMPPFVNIPNPRHRFFFGHRIVIRGNGGDCGDGPVVRCLLRG